MVLGLDNIQKSAPAYIVGLETVFLRQMDPVGLTVQMFPQCRSDPPSNGPIAGVDLASGRAGNHRLTPALLDGLCR